MSSKRKWDQAAPEESRDDPESPAKLAKVDESKNASTAAAAAAAIAAKIAAQYSGAGAGSGGGLLGPKDIHDGDFTQDIDINDVRNRYMLTKGSTQQQVRHPSLSHSLRTYLVNARVHFTFRYTTKQELPSAQKAYGTPIAQRPRRKTLRCTYTYPQTQKKCCSWPWTESMSSSQLTWGLLSRIKESEKRCVPVLSDSRWLALTPLFSANGLRKKSLSAWSRSVILTCAPRLLALL
jgi:hypothetical protein